MRPTRLTVLAIGWLACSTVIAACGGATADPSGGEGEVSGGIVVFAAASLTEPFRAIGEAFEREHPGTEVTFNFAGSSTLARQIVEGAPADVFASADTSNMEKIVDAGEAEGSPVTFATNVLRIIVEPGNPKGIRSLADLARPDVVFVVAAPEVPAGRYAAEVLEQAGAAATPASYEQDVKAVVNKVVLGEADAGLVYVSDVHAAGAGAEGVEIPQADNVRAEYPIVVTRSARNDTTAAAFVDHVTGPEGRRVLGQAGFGAP